MCNGGKSHNHGLTCKTVNEVSCQNTYVYNFILIRIP